MVTVDMARLPASEAMVGDRGNVQYGLSATPHMTTSPSCAISAYWAGAAPVEFLSNGFPPRGLDKAGMIRRHKAIGTPLDGISQLLADPQRERT